MRFEVVSGVDRRMGRPILDVVHVPQVEWEILFGGFILFGLKGVYLTEMYSTRA